MLLIDHISQVVFRIDYNEAVYCRVSLKSGGSRLLPSEICCSGCCNDCGDRPGKIFQYRIEHLTPPPFSTQLRRTLRPKPGRSKSRDFAGAPDLLDRLGALLLPAALKRIHPVHHVVEDFHDLRADRHRQPVGIRPGEQGEVGLGRLRDSGGDQPANVSRAIGDTVDVLILPIHCPPLKAPPHRPGDPAFCRAWWVDCWTAVRAPVPPSD
jgi:hypothetical protein